jgi:hypothetical protein
MFTVLVLPLAALIQIGKLHQSPRANQRVGFPSGTLSGGNADQQQRATERVNHFHFGVSNRVCTFTPDSKGYARLAK